MQKTLRYLVIIILLVFIGIQFFQPAKNQSEMSEKHLLRQEQVPENMQNLLKNACLDCHSNNTDYKWFHQIAPVSWMVNQHIIDGKDDLNLSEWGDMDVFDKIKNLEQICRETERHRMPLKSYSAIHKKAKLSEDQIAELCEWTTKLSEELLAEAMKN
jgi:hypothetical protein